MRRVRTELGLGARIALSSPTNRMRTALTAAGVVLGVVLLLLAASVPHALSVRHARDQARQPVGGGRHAPLRYLETDTALRGTGIGGATLQAVGPDAPLPPGVRTLPGPGEMVVSPALASLLGGPHGAELRRRLHARVVGTIGDAGLSGPGEPRFYRGSDALAGPHSIASDVLRFGTVTEPGPTSPIVTLLVIVMVVALLLPVGLFVATAARFGAEERDRRLAALRLIGADSLTTARVATGETLVGALAGLLAGAALFAALRPLASHVEIAGVSVFASDLRPSAWLAALVAVLVPLSAIAATLLGIRRVAIEPLGVSRHGAVPARRLGWRLVAPALGFLLLAPLIGSGSRLGSGGGQAEAVAGVLLVLAGLTAVLPWIVEGVVRRAPDGPLPWLLAIRRPRGDEGTSGRVVGAIGLAVAGAVALQILFGAAQVHARAGAGPRPAGVYQVTLAGSPGHDAPELAALRALPGVRRIASVSRDRRSLTAQVALDPGDAGAPDRLRDRAAALTELAQVTPLAGEPDHTLTSLRRALFAGAVLVLAMIGASLLVAAGEQLRERRRALAVLSAVGMRRSTMAWSMLWQAAIPVGCGLVLAVALGLGLGNALTAIVSLGPSYDWGAIALMAGAGAAVIATVTLLTLPTLSRMMRPDALRVE